MHHSLDEDQVMSLLNEHHSVKDWYSTFASLSSIQQVDAQEFEILKNRAMVDLTGGVTPLM